MGTCPWGRQPGLLYKVMSREDEGRINSLVKAKEEDSPNIGAAQMNGKEED